MCCLISLPFVVTRCGDEIILNAMAAKTEKELSETLHSLWFKAVTAIELRNFGYAISLLQELEMLNKTWLGQKKTKGGSIYSQRIVRIYDSSNGTPTIFILKPDAYRYWTRSMGLHDADEVAADLARWNAEAGRATMAWG